MAWSPTEYLKFEDERTRPAHDLLAQVPLARVVRGFDLGCGPGNSTRLLAERFDRETISGVDGDPAMIAAARTRLPGTQFELADLASWQVPEGTDLLFANAVFQWLPDHVDILERLMTALVPGGVLAVQMPDNLAEPSHRLMEEEALAGPWRDMFAGNPARRAALPSPSVYHERLAPLSTRINLWHTIYHHPMADAPAIVDWVKSTGLRAYLDRLPADRNADFLAGYTRRVAEAYKPLADGTVLFDFPRLFLVAIRS